MNTSSEKYKIKASIWKHPRILEVLGKQIAEELEEKKDEYAKELQEKKDQLERLNRYHTALQSIRITTEFIQKNNIIRGSQLGRSQENGFRNFRILELYERHR